MDERFRGGGGDVETVGEGGVIRKEQGGVI